MKHVLIINQSAELYGADKALLELIENYASGYTPIVVVHHDGPLIAKLEELQVKVIKCSVIKVKRGILSASFFLKLPFEIFKSFSVLRKELKGIKIDLVHSNAISVFLGAFYSLFYRKKHLWHVHEIIEHPKTLARLYPKVVSFFSDTIVFNSAASFAQFKKFKKNIDAKSVIIHNGQTRNFPIGSVEESVQIRQKLFNVADRETVVIGLIGRISRLKGQRLLLKAFKTLTEKYKNIHLVYVGSAPEGQEHFVEKLVAKIDSYHLGNSVTLVDFQESVWPIYDAVDIVVVPSTEPESFGLVATEAMLSRKPVVASNFGGLIEIVKHGQTGLLFEPKNATDLHAKLEMLVADDQKEWHLVRRVMSG